MKFIICLVAIIAFTTSGNVGLLGGLNDHWKKASGSWISCTTAEITSFKTCTIGEVKTIMEPSVCGTSFPDIIDTCA